ncbi:hypothetical protein VTK56DRAFT_5476 [Thermocarpiscus australiensis]
MVHASAIGTSTRRSQQQSSSSSSSSTATAAAATAAVAVTFVVELAAVTSLARPGQRGLARAARFQEKLGKETMQPTPKTPPRPDPRKPAGHRHRCRRGEGSEPCRRWIGGSGRPFLLFPGFLFLPTSSPFQTTFQATDTTRAHHDRAHHKRGHHVHFSHPQRNVRSERDCPKDASQAGFTSISRASYSSSSSGSFISDEDSIEIPEVLNSRETRSPVGSMPRIPSHRPATLKNSSGTLGAGTAPSTRLKAVPISSEPRTCSGISHVQVALVLCSQPFPGARD